MTIDSPNVTPPPSRSPAPLPIDDVLPQLLDRLDDHAAVLLRAPTGAGKTTRVPGAMLDRLPGSGSVVMLEPRRIAARAAARRIAEERGAKLGGEVGYRVRFDDKTSKSTRLCVMTEGVFLRKLQSDPFLEGIDAVVFDEFHERSLQSDLALALSRRVQADVRPDLRIVVMSATLESGPLQEFLGEAGGEPAPLIESQGRLFPVEERFLTATERPARDTRLEDLVRPAVLRALAEGGGDVLVFLPGVGEIKRAGDSLRGERALRNARLLELYGDLDAHAQDEVFRSDGRRKVVLATNIAETSLTIPGITAVVDAGLARRLVYDTALGLDRLELQPISRASAKQRAGRAGRTAPGICYRLWTAGDERGRLAEDVPEVRRIDLSGAALELACFGERELESFGWFESPPPAALQRARELLTGLGAIDAREDGSWRVTSRGRRLNALPLAPRLGQLLLEGARAGVTREAATCAALLAERSPFRRERFGAAQRVSPHDSDWLDAVYALEGFERSGATRSASGELMAGPARGVLRARDQLARLVRDEVELNDIAARDSATLRALFAAFPDRLACRREEDTERAVMVGGRGVRLARESGVRESQLFVCVDLDAGGRESLVRRASAVEREWLGEQQLSTGRHHRFDNKLERVVTTEETRYQDLVLETRTLPTTRDAETAVTLYGAAKGDLERALSLSSSSAEQWLARLACVREWRAELELPASNEELLRAALEHLCQGRASFEELRKAPLLEALRNVLGWQSCRLLDEHAPERLAVPSGSQITLRYESGRPPVLAARIQELFGLAETPRVAGGRVPVLLHLLAPNRRPQQITDDLRSFWDGAYSEVRKELRRRYPKHSWPEDPWTAQAVRGVRRKKS